MAWQRATVPHAKAYARAPAKGYPAAQARANNIPRFGAGKGFDPMADHTREMRKTNPTARLALCGMMAALIFVATYFITLPMAMTTGYVHLGDGFILLAAALLGWAAVPAAAIGSMLADLLGGYVTYLLPTLLIKAAVAAVAVLAVRAKAEWFRVLGFILAEAVMVAGYFVVEWLFLGYGFAAASASVLGNTMQGLSGVVIGLLLIPLMKRIKV